MSSSNRNASLPTPRAWTRALLAAALFCGSASAHDVFPAQITLQPGGLDFIYVADAGTCPASITVVSSNSGLVTLQAIDMNTGVPTGVAGGTVTVNNRIDQVFLVRAVPGAAVPASATVEVCWIGKDFPGGFCNENNCSPYSPTVVSIQVDAEPKTAGSRLSSGIALDPVATSTGSLFLPEGADFRLGGPMPLGLWRHYSSRLVADGAPVGALGPNWLHNFEWSLESVGNALHVHTNEGRVVRFEKGYFDLDWELAVQEDVPFQLVENGPLFVLGDPRDGRRYTFDAGGSLLMIEDGRGNSHTLTYSQGRLTQVADGLGRSLSFAYGGSGELTGVSDGTRSVQFGFDGLGRLETAADTLGKVTTYAYDAGVPGDALMTARTLPEGNTPWTQTWTGGRVATQSDAYGNTWSFSYDTVNGATTITDPDTNTVVHTHSSEGRLTGWTDEAGMSASLGSDAKGRRSSVTDRDGKTSTTSYDAISGKPRTVTDADGSQTSFTFVSRTVGGITERDVTDAIWPGNMKVTLTHDANGNSLTETGPGGQAWAYGYNASGQPTTVTSPGGATVAVGYNNDGTVASFTDPGGRVTSLGYDPLRRLTQITYQDGATCSFSYDLEDRVLSMTDELSRVTSYGYDDNGNLVSFAPQGTPATLFSFDLMDRLETWTDPLGGVSTAAFDALGRTASITNANGHAVGYGYDPLGNLDLVTTPLGKIWQQSYTAEGIPASRTNPLGNTETYTSDARGRVRSRRDPLGATANYSYDGENRLTRYRDQKGNPFDLSYGSSGGLIEIRTPLPGVKTTLSRNSLGQVDGLTGPGGHTWSFDSSAAGQPLGETDPLGRTTQHTWNANGQLAQSDLAGLGTVDYTYDVGWRLTNASYSDGLNIPLTWHVTDKLATGPGLSASYDAAGRLDDINGIGVGRDLGGRITSFDYGPGLTVSYTYNDDDTLAQVTDWAGGGVSFTYDDAGLRTGLDRSNGLNSTFSYDPNGSLSGLQHDALGSISLTRNAAGEIIHADRMLLGSMLPLLGSRTWSFDAAQQATDASYDPLGRQLDDKGEVFQWSLSGDLLQRDDGVAPVNYTYDALHLLRTRSVGGTTETFTHNYATGLPSLAWTSVGGSIARRNIFTVGGELLYSIEDGTNARTFYHHDENYNTRGLSDDAGNVVGTIDYTPLGEVTGRSGATDTSFTWRGGLGAWNDPMTPYYNNCGRWYHSKRGRHLSPLQSVDVSPTLINRYQLDANNPLGFGDSARSGVINTVTRGGDLPNSDRFTGTAVLRLRGLPHVGELAAELPMAQFADIFLVELPGSETNYKKTVQKFRAWSEFARALATSSLFIREEFLASAPRNAQRAPFGSQSGFPVFNFAERRSEAFHWESVTPRLGLSYSVGGDRKTLLRANYTSFSQQLGSNSTAPLSALGARGLGAFNGGAFTAPAGTVSFLGGRNFIELPQGSPFQSQAFNALNPPPPLPATRGVLDRNDFVSDTIGPRVWRVDSRIHWH